MGNSSKREPIWAWLIVNNDSLRDGILHIRKPDYRDAQLPSVTAIYL